MKEYKGRCQGCMSAKVNFDFGGEPSQFVKVLFFYCKSGFGQVVFLGDFLHQFWTQPRIQNADRSRIPAKSLAAKGIYLVNLLSHRHGFRTKLRIKPNLSGFAVLLSTSLRHFLFRDDGRIAIERVAVSSSIYFQYVHSFLIQKGCLCRVPN